MSEYKEEFRRVIKVIREMKSGEEKASEREGERERERGGEAKRNGWMNI